MHRNQSCRTPDSLSSGGGLLGGLKMKKLILAICLMAGPVFAQIDPVAQAQLEAIRNGSDSADGIQDLFVKDDGTILDDLIVGGNITASQAVTFVAGVTAPSDTAGLINSTTNLSMLGAWKRAQSSLTVTSGQIIVFSTSPVIAMTAGGADLTVTATIAAVSAAYASNTYVLVNVGASNGVLITDSAPVYNSGATLGITDISTYFVVATNQIIQESTSNN